MKPPCSTVASSPSPKPSSAGPACHEVSSKPGSFHAVPWSDPSSRYFQTDPSATSVLVSMVTDVVPSTGAD